MALISSTSSTSSTTRTVIAPYLTFDKYGLFLRNKTLPLLQLTVVRAADPF